MNVTDKAINSKERMTDLFSIVLLVFFIVAVIYLVVTYGL